MATNKLLPFAYGNSANILEYDAWSNLPARSTGFQSGIANSKQFNRILAQGGAAAYVLGQTVVDYAGVDADLNQTELYRNFLKAMARYIPDGVADESIKLAKIKGAVKTVNGAAPDRYGNIAVATYSEPDTGVTAGTYNKVTVNSKGKVISGSNTVFANVATSGRYSDLFGTPLLASVATSGRYSDLSGTPSLASVATSGNYYDLSNRPSIPSMPSYYLTSTWRNGDSWYRRYSDGFIIQGGIIENAFGAIVTVTFPIRFSSFNNIVLGSVGNAESISQVQLGSDTNLTTFQIRRQYTGNARGSGWCYWVAHGF